MDSEIKKIRTHKKWTQEEDNIIIENYISKGIKYCSQKINYRRSDSITLRARKLGVLKTEKRVCKLWSNDDDTFIKENYSENGAFFCSKILKRNIHSIHSRASLLNCHLSLEMKSITNKNNNKKYQENRPNSDFKVNIENFLNITKKEVAYFLGYFWADGYIPINRNISGTRNEIRLGIAEEDLIEIKNKLVI